MDFAQGVRLAHGRIARDIVRTELALSASLSRLAKARVYIKWESGQKSGSFKLRGALNRIRTLPRSILERGVVSASTGNHGAALAEACAMEKVDLTLFLPVNAAPYKVEKLRQTRARVELFGPTCEAAEMHARKRAEESGGTYVSPYNDAQVVFGQGTVGLEALEDLADPGAVLVPVGGGGLISGIGGYLKSALGPAAPRILGVEPSRSAHMSASVAAGKILTLSERETVADAVAGGIEPGSITLDLCCRYVDGFVTVEEDEIIRAMGLIYDAHGVMVEGAAALAAAGLLKQKHGLTGMNVLLVASGANITPRRFHEAMKGE